MKWISQQSSELSLGVRIPPGAHIRVVVLERKYCFRYVLLKNHYFHKVLWKTVDNCVGNVNKGQGLVLSFRGDFNQNSL